MAPLAAFLLAAVCLGQEVVPPSPPREHDAKFAAPPLGKLYHGIYPGGKSGDEDDLRPRDLEEYQKAVGQQAAWVYFSNNWFRTREFPLKTATWIRAAKAVPYIRLMLRSNSEQDQPEKLFSVQAILAGEFDRDLKRWAAQAKAFGSPLLVEWGTECNGEWFPWNAKWGAGEEARKKERAEGAERFAAAYRHIIGTMREEGAANLTWVFHPNCSDEPEAAWNRLESYYPGDGFIDWIAVSVYGPQKPMEKEALPFVERMDACYRRIEKLAPSKPVIVAEFGCTAGSKAARPERWAAVALDAILAARWKNVIGFSWWNERWENDDDHAHDTTMRVQDIPALAEVFKTKLESAKEKLAPAAVAP